MLSSKAGMDEGRRRRSLARLYTIKLGKKKSLVGTAGQARAGGKKTHCTLSQTGREINLKTGLSNLK